MKRVIKFRGKRLADGEWIYGDFFRNRGLAFIAADGIVENPLASWKDYNVDPDTVGQFTGLHDAQGKEIYVGDILRMSCRKDDLGIVKWENEAAAFTIREKGKLRWWYLINRHYELVGNVHDNPELLKGGQDEQTAE